MTFHFPKTEVYICSHLTSIKKKLNVMRMILYNNNRRFSYTELLHSRKGFFLPDTLLPDLLCSPVVHSWFAELFLAFLVICDFFQQI